MIRRFRPNVLLCLHLYGWTVADLGSRLWGHMDGRADTFRRRGHRLLKGRRGGVRVTLNDVERIAEIFSISPALLAYGSAADVKTAILSNSGAA